MPLRTIILLSVALASTVEVLAQDALLLYHLEAAPKRLLLNPAAPVSHRAWLSLPGVGHVDQTFQLPWAASDVLDLSNTSARALLDGSSAVDIEDIRLDLPAAIDGISPLGRSRITTRLNLLSFGVQLPRGLAFLNVDQQVDFYAGAGPSALLGLYYGEPYVRSDGINVRGYEFDVQLRTSYSLGYQINPGGGAWRFGVNAKLVKFQGHAHLKALDVEVTIEDEQRVAVYYQGRNQIAGWADINDGPTPLSDVTWKRLFAGGNYGFGLDLGVHYQRTERLHLSASLTDFGLARLGDKTREYAFENTIRRGDNRPLSTLERVTIRRATAEVEDLSRVGQTQAINADAYTQVLPATLYLGGEYRFAGRHSAGLVVRNSMRGGHFQTAAAASLNLRPWRLLEVSPTVGWADGAGVGIGFGASLQLGVFQVYAGSDNLLAFGDLEGARWMNAVAGVTLILPGRGDGSGSGGAQQRRSEPAIKCYKF